jgi:hypothetical protein
MFAFPTVQRTSDFWLRSLILAWRSKHLRIRDFCKELAFAGESLDHQFKRLFAGARLQRFSRTSLSQHADELREATGAAAASGFQVAPIGTHALSSGARSRKITFLAGIGRGLLAEST